MIQLINKTNTIKIKPVDVKSSIYTDSSEIDDKDPKFKIDNIVRISKYKTKESFHKQIKKSLELKNNKKVIR